MVVANGDDGNGYAEDSALDVAALDMEAVADRAIGIARRAQHPVAVPPDTYTVILQPEAVADMAHFLAVLGFGAQAVQEGRSFVAGKRGQTVLGENVTIWDDGHDPSGLPLPFDFEGVPRQRLSLIERGVAGDIALDSLYAGMMGARTNGHALPAATDFHAGPIPLHVFMQPGEATVDEMIRSTERGLLVTYFHYTRVVHPLYVIITGMTRYGTFLIERGEVTRPVKSLRYTQSYLDALRDVQAIGRETRLSGEGIAARVPALKIGRFTFTGVTE
jgi:predicted Zn-dependent protease